MFDIQTRRRLCRLCLIQWHCVEHRKFPATFMLALVVSHLSNYKLDIEAINAIKRAFSALLSGIYSYSLPLWRSKCALFWVPRQNWTRFAARFSQWNHVICANMEAKKKNVRCVHPSPGKAELLLNVSVDFKSNIKRVLIGTENNYNMIKI